LRAASVDEIAAVPGVGRRTAEAVHASLAAQTASGSAPAPAVDPVTGEIIEESVSVPADTGTVGVAGSEPIR